MALPLVNELPRLDIEGDIAQWLAGPRFMLSASTFAHTASCTQHRDQESKV